MEQEAIAAIAQWAGVPEAWIRHVIVNDGECSCHLEPPYEVVQTYCNEYERIREQDYSEQPPPVVAPSESLPHIPVQRIHTIEVTWESL